ncbi:MAG: AIR synthase related protein, partial [Bdellovibrionota bacterium]
PGLRPFELVVSESQERMTVAVDPAQLDAFRSLATRRAVEVSDLGDFNDSGFFEITMGETPVAKLPLEFLHEGNPRMAMEARFDVPPGQPEHREASFANGWASILTALLARPNIASKEWLIRQYDHEVQGMSVVKPLHQSEPGGFSGPNDSGVIVLGAEAGKTVGLAVGCGLNPKLSDVDPYLMAASAVDEAVRNVLCTGGEYGGPEKVIALVDNFCWPDPTHDVGKAAALVRASAGMAQAALALGIPLVSGKDSMKNDFKGRLGEEEVKISVPPTLLMTAIARVGSVGSARTSDFKCPGDFIYLLGHGASEGALGLRGTEIEAWFREQGREIVVADATTPILPGLPNWAVAKRVFAWIGGLEGARAARVASLHDVSDGGLMVAIAEGL